MIPNQQFILHMVIYPRIVGMASTIISQCFLLKLLNEGTFFSGLKASGPTVSTMEAMAHLSP